MSVDIRLARCLLSLTCVGDIDWELMVLRASHGWNLMDFLFPVSSRHFCAELPGRGHGRQGAGSSEEMCMRGWPRGLCGHSCCRCWLWTFLQVFCRAEVEGIKLDKTKLHP